MNLSARDQRVIWHPYTQMQLADPPIAMVRGEGTLLYDDQGREYIDAISSWWVNIHGHAQAYLAQKVSEQLKKLEQVLFAGFTHEPAVELAERLLGVLPPNQRRIFYSDNGSTAVEVAIKMGIQYWYNKGIRKNKIIAFQHAYHGDTFGAMSVSARGAFTHPFKDLLFEVKTIPFPEKGKEQETITQLQTIIASGEVAAFIFEPLVLGAGGMLMYESEKLNEMIRICQENSVLTIADEVMTGFGRTGKNFACEYISGQPDIICLSKGITGGLMPLGVTSCTENIFNAFLSNDKSKTFFHGHSYTANPLACVAAIASLELLLTPECRNAIHHIGQKHYQFIDENKDNESLKGLRSMGTILAMEIVTGEPDSYFNTLRDRLYKFFLEKGVLLRPLGNTVYVMPPYCITDIELDRVYKAIHLAVTDIHQFK